MTIPTETLAEQLSAFMDGELPEAEARFLRRRLEHDEELRCKWARMHVSSACMKGQPWQPMPAALSGRVAAGLAGAVAVPAERPLLRWAMLASVAALAVLFVPRLVNQGERAPAAISASASGPAVDHILASPASADLVALRPASDPAPRADRAVAGSAASVSDFIKGNPGATAQESPLPLSAQSPTEFPLLDSASKRSWPRSELIAGANDPAIEAYLVRHNQMLANDGLGGFVPYLDVVARDPSATVPEQDVSTRDAGANQQ